MQFDIIWTRANMRNIDAGRGFQQLQMRVRGKWVNAGSAVPLVKTLPHGVVITGGAG